MLETPLSELRSDSLVTLTLPGNYGFCILVAVESVIVIAWKKTLVERARRKYNVPYPLMFSDKEQQFNSIHRSYQRTLEHYPQFLSLLLLGGLENPLITAGGGAFFLLGRIVYALGCYSGDQRKRINGAFGYIGLIAMLGTTTKLALKLLQII